MTPEIRTADWDSFAAVMGERGGAGGCWCMLWRLSRRAWEAGKGEGNREAMRRRFAEGPPPGLVAFADGKPAGWIHVDARAAFPRLATSRILKPVDNLPVWSVACFLVARPYRRRGIGRALLEAAADHARAHGAPALEGYPVEVADPTYPPVYAWTGFAETFRAAGFEEVARRSPTRPVMRRTF